MRTPIAMLVLLSFAIPAFAGERVVTDFRCLSGGKNYSIHLEWRSFIDVPTKWITAYVKYKTSAKPISLVLKSEEATEKPANRPWESTSVWLEVVDGRFTGEYTIVSQGANIYSFTYKNYNNSRSTDFNQDNEAMEGDECKWD